MKIVLIVPDTGRTYALFRRQVARFIAEAKAVDLEGAKLRAELDVAIRGWRAEGFAKSWVVQARAEVLRGEPPLRQGLKPVRGRPASSLRA